MSNEQFPQEIRSKIYRPGEGEQYYTETVVGDPEGFEGNVEIDTDEYDVTT